MKHIFVFDPKAFVNQQWKMDIILDNIGQFFRTQDKPDFSIQMSRYRRNAIVLVQEEAEKAGPYVTIRIYAVGGDEIFFDCINAAAHLQDAQVAVIPHGGSFDLLRTFIENKVDIDVYNDLPSLVTSGAVPVDILKWGVNYASNSCYIGLNSAVSSKLKKLKEKIGKSGLLVFSKISSLLNYFFTAFDRQITAQQYSITIDGKDYSGNYCLIHITNGQYFAGKRIGAYKAAPDDGLLDITLIKSTGTLRTIFAVNRYSKGKQVKNSISLQAKKISIKSDRRMWIQLDNEYFQDTLVDIKVEHHAVHLVVPGTPANDDSDSEPEFEIPEI